MQKLKNKLIIEYNRKRNRLTDTDKVVTSREREKDGGKIGQGMKSYQQQY